MTGPEYPVEPEVALALERLRRTLETRLTRLEAKVDAITSPPPAGATRGAVIGAASAGFSIGLIEALRRLFS